MGFLDVFLPWLVIRSASSRSSQTLYKEDSSHGIPSRMKKGKRMECAWFPMEPMTICEYGWNPTGLSDPQQVEAASDSSS